MSEHVTVNALCTRQGDPVTGAEVTEIEFRLPWNRTCIDHAKAQVNLFYLPGETP